MCFRRDRYRCRYIDRGRRCVSAHRLECHHAGADDDHSLDNLLTLCHAHHAHITGKDARAVQLGRAKRTPETHPGLRN